MIGKVFVILVLIVVGWYAYSNYNFQTVEICTSKTATELAIPCDTASDCIAHMKVMYATTYPETDVFNGIMTQVSGCNTNGMCTLKSFDFAENRPSGKCEPTETNMIYKVTLKDLMAIKEGSS